MTNTDSLFKELIFDYLETLPNWEELKSTERKKLFQLYNTILNSVHTSINNPELFPVLFARNGKSKKIIEEAINNLRSIVPEVDRITVRIIN